jgi:hypothetical protein
MKWQHLTFPNKTERLRRIIEQSWMQQPPTKFGDWIYPCNASNVDPFMEPTRYSKVIIFPQAWEWKMAMEDEMKSLL